MRVMTKTPLKQREKCGDCFYNGYCKDNLRKCKYLKIKKY